MTEKLKQDIIDFEIQKITKEELLTKLPFPLRDKSTELRRIISKIIDDKIGSNVQFGLTLMWLLEENNEFTDLLHILLLEPWHNRYEDLIHALQARMDPSSVPIIEMAIQNKYEYLESYGTGTGQFISQCGYALYAIGSEEAKKTIRHLSHSEDEQIRREMIYQLKRLENNPDTENTTKTPRWWT